MEKKFANQELEKVVALAKEMGLKVWASDGTFYNNIITYVFFDNGKHCGYCEQYYGGVKYSTCHVSEHGSGCGAGFTLDSRTGTANKEDIDRTFMYAPHWASHYTGFKKISFEQHIEHSKLRYHEL